MTEMKKIQEYGLANFSKVLQEAVLEGYRLDLDKNDGVPQAYGGFFECEVYLTDVVTSVVTKVEPVVSDINTSIISDEPVSDVLSIEVLDKVLNGFAGADTKPARGRPKRT